MGHQLWLNGSDIYNLLVIATADFEDELWNSLAEISPGLADSLQQGPRHHSR